MSNDVDACVPKVLMDFVFDLYDSVTLSQLAEEQSKLYNLDFRELHQKYFTSTPWPSPQSIASECNGNPLFLSVYRELTHRQWHAQSRPTIRDRMEGWQVYRELFEEILESDGRFYLLPSWCFDILHEFVYQFQGYCQVKSAVYASARKHGLIQNVDGTMTINPNVAAGAAGNNNSNQGPSTTLQENLNMIETSDAWDVEAVFGYLHRLVEMGFPGSPEGAQEISPVYTYLGVFSSVALSRLECLLGDYTSCLQALTPLVVHANYVIVKEDIAPSQSVRDVVSHVVGAKISLAYHVGISYLMLRRYRDALHTIGDICASLQRGFKTGQLRRLTGGAGNSNGIYEQYQKQYDRMLSLLIILQQICPTSHLVLEDSVKKAMREKYGTRVEQGGNANGNTGGGTGGLANSSSGQAYEEYFLSPKFITTNNVSHTGVFHRQQVQAFVQEMHAQPAFQKLRSFLKLYTSLSIEKLARFHDKSVPEFLPILLSYKSKLRQYEREYSLASTSTMDGTCTPSAATAASVADPSGAAASIDGTNETYVGDGKTRKTALDIHFYLVNDTCYIDEAEKQRRFETYFTAQIIQNHDILKEALSIDTDHA